MRFKWRVHRKGKFAITHTRNADVKHGKLSNSTQKSKKVNKSNTKIQYLPIRAVKNTTHFFKLYHRPPSTLSWRARRQCSLESRVSAWGANALVPCLPPGTTLPLCVTCAPPSRPGEVFRLHWQRHQSGHELWPRVFQEPLRFCSSPLISFGHERSTSQMKATVSAQILEEDQHGRS